MSPSRVQESLRPFPVAVGFLADAGVVAPSADNSQPWHFSWGRTLDLHYRQPTSQQAFLPSDHPATLLALGAAVENLVQAANAIGLPCTAPLDGAGGCGPIVQLTVGTVLRVPHEALTHPLFRRHTNRFPFARKPVPDSVLQGLVSLGEFPARCIVLTQPDHIEVMSGLVRQASEARFQTREINDLLSQSLRFTPEEVRRGDGLDVATLCLPPGGRHMLRFMRSWKRMSLLNRLGAYKVFAQVEGAAIAAAPALVAILAPAGATAAMAAGRLLERVWIELNRVGLAVHPYFVITDQLYRLRQGTVPAGVLPLVERMKVSLHQLVGTGQGEVLMLLRIGWPTVDPPRSLRRPLAASLSGGAAA